MKDFEDRDEIGGEADEFSGETDFEFDCEQAAYPPYPPYFPAPESAGPAPCPPGSGVDKGDKEKLQPPVISSVSVRRPDDLLIFDLIFKGLVFKEDPPRLERASKAAYIIFNTMLGPWGWIKDADNVTESRQLLPFRGYFAVLRSGALVLFPTLFKLAAKWGSRATGSRGGL